MTRNLDIYWKWFWVEVGPREKTIPGAPCRLLDCKGYRRNERTPTLFSRSSRGLIFGIGVSTVKVVPELWTPGCDCHPPQSARPLLWTPPPIRRARAREGPPPVVSVSVTAAGCGRRGPEGAETGSGVPSFCAGAEGAGRRSRADYTRAGRTPPQTPYTKPKDHASTLSVPLLLGAPTSPNNLYFGSSFFVPDPAFFPASRDTPLPPPLRLEVSSATRPLDRPYSSTHLLSRHP